MYFWRLSRVGLRNRQGRLGIAENLGVVHDGRSAFRFGLLMQYVESRRGDPLKNILSEDDAKVREALAEAHKYYCTIVPENTYVCPSEIERTEAYQYAEVDRVLALAADYGIDVKTEPYLVWVARMALCLTLPPFWRRQPIGDQVLFYNMELDIMTSVDPTKEFVTGFLRSVRHKVAEQGLGFIRELSRKLAAKTCRNSICGTIRRALASDACF